MRKLFFILALTGHSFCAEAQSGPVLVRLQEEAAVQYIGEHARLAVREMRLYGIPASLTLAQALLESRGGLSRLAAEGNNHFGIKTHKDWQGDTLLIKDDDFGSDGELIESSFRRYRSASLSFADHSSFLRTRPRYASLFELDPADYAAWAEGLQKAGYATDLNYAAKLIELIERYGLDRYDAMASQTARRPTQFFMDETSDQTDEERSDFWSAVAVKTFKI